MRTLLPLLSLCCLSLLAALPPSSFAETAKTAPEMIIFDTDIGDDIDDAFALGLLLRSPEVQVLGVTTAFKDTHLRARLATRLLEAAGREDIPVYQGVRSQDLSGFTQLQWAEGSPDRHYGDALSFTLDTIRTHPGQITLVAVAPLTNVGALLARDPATFRKLKRVVLMGGSVHRGYDHRPAPEAEWNIKCDPAAAQALFASGVPLFVMPLDATEIPLSPEVEKSIFSAGTPLSRALEVLTSEWSAANNGHTPTLFDAITAGFVVQPGICPMSPIRLDVDRQGFTRPVAGAPNAQVCLTQPTQAFFHLFLPRMR